MLSRHYLPLILTGCLLWPAGASGSPLETTAERTDYRRTGRYSEVLQLCEAFLACWPASVSVEEFGQTPAGRPMKALVVSSGGCLTPQMAKSQGKPVLLIQGGIHAGEIDGKDAGFAVLRRLLQEDSEILSRVVIVFVPVFNIDGHERFGAYNRPNQVGPEEMGWRVTGQNLNLNRDYTKADAPEMQAMLRLLNRWDPVLYVDLHVTDGAQLQTDVAVLMEPVFAGDSGLHPRGREIQKAVLEELREQSISAVHFYPSLRDPANPLSGFADGAYPARFSTGYWALRNRFSVLVETHSWKNYKRRVAVTEKTLLALFREAAKNGNQWLEWAREADNRSRTLGGQVVPLTYENGGRFHNIEFPGYSFSYSDSKISGQKALKYDSSKPQVWEVPLYDEVRVKDSVRAPKGGYIVPPAYAAVMEAKLQLHSLRYQRIPESGIWSVEKFLAESSEFGSRPYEGRMTLRVRGSWRQGSHQVEAGSLFVPVDQPGAHLLLALLEPFSGDSLLNWGFFNSHFEQKEYMEDYVTELVGQQMLERDPALRREFENKLATDPKFANSPQARLDFFYRRHPSYDSQFNLYPILRVESRPENR